MSIIVIDLFYRKAGRLWLDTEIFFWIFLYFLRLISSWKYNFYEMKHDGYCVKNYKLAIVLTHELMISIKSVSDELFKMFHIIVL